MKDGATEADNRKDLGRLNVAVYYRACPRCRGDVQINQDVYGEYKECLQCGYMLDTLYRPKRRDTWQPAKAKPGRKREAA